MFSPKSMSNLGRLTVPLSSVLYIPLQVYPKFKKKPNQVCMVRAQKTSKICRCTIVQYDSSLCLVREAIIQYSLYMGHT